MPESAVSKMPNAHNHRDDPPGTAVKYGNGELETMPMEAMEDITILRRNFPRTLTITEQAQKQETGATIADLPQPRA
jgi:hypothetical protein